MNARERRKVFLEYLQHKKLPEEHFKVLKKLQVPPSNTIVSQLGIKEHLPEEELIKRYIDFLLEHIKDPVEYTRQVQEQAKKLIDIGLKPIPLYAGTKVPIGTKWREKYLTLTKDQVPLVWNSTYNIGVLTGQPSNLICLDFESKEAFDGFIEVLQTHPAFVSAGFLERLGPTPVEDSGKGVHMFLLVKDTPDKIRLLDNINAMSKRFFKDFEIRWGEGQVAVAPSLHPSGKFYTPRTIEEGDASLTLTLGEVPISEIQVADVARILDAYHKTGKIRVEKFRLIEYTAYIARLLGVEDKYRKGLVTSVATIDFSTEVDDEKEAALLNACKKIWPEPGAGRWAASCAISALFGILGVPKETTKRIIEKLVRTLQPDTPEGWIRDLAEVYPEATYRDLEGYQREVELAKQMGKQPPKLPVSYKSLLLANTSIPEEVIDEWRREVEQILTVKVADRLGFHKSSDKEPAEEVTDHLVLRYLLPDELQGGDVKVEIIESKEDEDVAFDIPLTEEAEGEETPLGKIIKRITIPVVKLVEDYQTRGGKRIKVPMLKFMYKIIEIPIGEDEEPRYSYTSGFPLITKPVKIEKAAYIGTEVYVRLNVGGFPLEGPIDTVVAELQRMKMISPRNGSWVGPYLAHIAKKEDGEFFTRLGVHLTKDGKFVWVGPAHEKYYPVSPMRIEFARAMKKYIANADEELYKAFIEAIGEYKKYINQEAYWLAMSYLFVAPLASAARAVFKIAPLMYFHNPLPGSGKTTLGKFIIQVGHGVKVFDKDILDSSFRFNETFDSIHGSLMFDEISNIRKEVLDALVAAATGVGSSGRGRGIASMRMYEPTASALFTSNKDAWQISDQARWLDRVVQVEVKPNLDLAMEYLRKIDDPFALSAIHDDAKVTVAHYFLPELVQMVNELGSVEWLKKHFNKWFNFAIEKGLVAPGGRRTQHKFAFFMVGLELMARFLKGKGLKVDVKEGARIIFNYFRREAVEVPRPLENFITFLSLIKHPDGKESLISYTYDSTKDAYLITNDILKLVVYEAKKYETRGNGIEVPQSLSELATLISSLKKYGTKGELYPRSGVWISSRNKTMKAVILPRALVDEILGIVRELELSEESGGEVPIEALNEVVNVLSMQEANYDELRQVTGIEDVTLAKALKKLEELGIIWAKNGKYHLINRKKAVEAGFNVIEEIRPGR